MWRGFLPGFLKLIHTGLLVIHVHTNRFHISGGFTMWSILSGNQSVRINEARLLIYVTLINQFSFLIMLC